MGQKAENKVDNENNMDNKAAVGVNNDSALGKPLTPTRGRLGAVNVEGDAFHAPAVAAGKTVLGGASATAMASPKDDTYGSDNAATPPRIVRKVKLSKRSFDIAVGSASAATSPAAKAASPKGASSGSASSATSPAKAASPKGASSGSASSATSPARAASPKGAGSGSASAATSPARAASPKGAGSGSASIGSVTPTRSSAASAVPSTERRMKRFQEQTKSPERWQPGSGMPIVIDTCGFGKIVAGVMAQPRILDAEYVVTKGTAAEVNMDSVFKGQIHTPRNMSSIGASSSPVAATVVDSALELGTIELVMSPENIKFFAPCEQLNEVFKSCSIEDPNIKKTLKFLFEMKAHLDYSSSRDNSDCCMSKSEVIANSISVFCTEYLPLFAATDVFNNWLNPRCQDALSLNLNYFSTKVVELADELSSNNKVSGNRVKKLNNYIKTQKQQIMNVDIKNFLHVNREWVQNYWRSFGQGLSPFFYMYRMQRGVRPEDPRARYLSTCFDSFYEFIYGALEERNSESKVAIQLPALTEFKKRCRSKKLSTALKEIYEQVESMGAATASIAEAKVINDFFEDHEMYALIQCKFADYITSYEAPIASLAFDFGDFTLCCEAIKRGLPLVTANKAMKAQVWNNFFRAFFVGRDVQIVVLSDVTKFINAKYPGSPTMDVEDITAEMILEYCQQRCDMTKLWGLDDYIASLQQASNTNRTLFPPSGARAGAGAGAGALNHEQKSSSAFCCGLFGGLFDSSDANKSIVGAKAEEKKESGHSLSHGLFGSISNFFSAKSARASTNDEQKSLLEKKAPPKR